MPRPVHIAMALALLAAGQLAAAADPAAPTGRGNGAKGTTPVAFEGSALLISFYSGASEALLERGVVVPGVTSLSGLSGGAFTAALLTIGLNGTEMLAFWQNIISRCATSASATGCVGQLNAHMEDLLTGLIPDDAARLVNGHVRIGMSQLDVSKPTLNGSASWIVDDFNDKYDLVSALTSTDFIPCWTGLTTYTHFRNQPVIDGGYANGFEQLCPGGDIANCIKVASWYVAGPGTNTTCDPDRCSSCAPTAERAEPIVPGPLNQTIKYVDQAPIVAIEQRCSAADFIALGLAPYPLPSFVPQNQTAIDIHPGKYVPLPEWDGQQLLACEWQDWASMLPKGRELEAMEVAFDYGYASASAFADEQGY